ncbi:OprO/OprP family phosphate-selective porin [Tamlana agarivorans]|uniref:OprO/OprP family phosphate-selective porin n=1 Tax=Pseudotamlana agarivorans TaxID=481183 RepID=A0ACC5U8F6_9FLAO|nr:porin [Tamlana agarivorans]MBU2950565.1 OprO/OprP family phosphate-selective porin [Tamlana agarivorans]
MNIKLTFLGVTMLAITSLSAQEIKTGAFGKGIFHVTGKDSTFTMNFAVRFQLLGFASWKENQPADLSFLVRRSRLKLDGFVYSPKLKYKFEAGFSNRDMSGGSDDFTHGSPRFIMDAFVDWNFYKNLILRVGQGKLPGNRERVISSANLQLVDRSLLNGKFNIDRDIGFQLKHFFNPTGNLFIREILSVSLGEGRNVTTGNLGGLQYVGGVEILPFGNFTSHGDYKGADLKREQTPKLAIAASYEFNNDAVRTRSNQGKYMLIDNDSGLFKTDVNTIFVDGMFKYKGYSFMFEYAKRDADDVLAKNSDGTLTGDIIETGNALNLQSGYLFKSNWEVTGRYTDLNMDSITMQNSKDMYTLGISKYIVGHKLKIQSDFSYIKTYGGTNEMLARLQMDVHF